MSTPLGGPGNVPPSLLLGPGTTNAAAGSGGNPGTFSGSGNGRFNNGKQPLGNNTNATSAAQKNLINNSSNKNLAKSQMNLSKGGGGDGDSRIDEHGSRRNGRGRCCKCLGPKSTAFWLSLLTNLGICTLLFAYTLLGEWTNKGICLGTVRYI